MTDAPRSSLSVRLLRILLPFAFGYFLSYIYRVVNAVLAPDLVADLGLDASLLGLLSSTYFLTFAAFQLPLGILLDRYGPRRIEATLLLIAAAGATLFALAESVPMLIFARGLIGLGVSACLMGAFKAYVVWFSKERLPLINGLQMAAGGLGALVGTTPVEMALGFTDWRGVFMGLAVLTVLASALVFALVPEHDAPHTETRLSDQIKGTIGVFQSPLFWRIAPVTMLTQAGFISVASLWAGPWFRDVAGLDRVGVANGLFWMATAMVAGFLSLGALAERLHRVGIRPVTVTLCAQAIFVAIGLVLAFLITPERLQAAPGLDIGLWMVFGFFGTSGIVAYAVLSQAFPPHLAGRVNTSINMLVFVLAFAGQWGLGIIIDQFPATGAGGYHPDAYRAALGLLAGLQALGILWYMAYRKARFD